jgi:multidrug efflux pump subunit AcrB
VTTLGAHVRSAVFGRESRRISRNREDVKIMVRYPESSRETLYDLESMWMPMSPNPLDRKWSPLGQIAQLTEAESFSSIHRSQQRHAVSVFAEVDEETGTNVTSVLDKVRENFDEVIKKDHPGVRIEFLGSSEERMKAFGGLWTAMPVALLLIYMLLAGLFRSYMQPVVVMSAIPFGFLGAVAGHWVTGYPMTILSWIGLLALTGIVVNDSLVLVSFINNRVLEGESEFEASVQGAKLRLRAILLTTLTTVSGLIPLMFETSFQAKFLIPMAVTLTFGLAFATMLTLVIVPTLNMIFFDVRNVFRRGSPHTGGQPPITPADSTNGSHTVEPGRETVKDIPAPV